MPRTIRIASALSAALLLAASVVACAPAAEPQEMSEPSGSADPAEIPGTPVGEQAQWVLAEINADEVAEESVFDERFDPVMFESISVADVQVTFGSLQDVGPWVATTYEGSETEARVRVESPLPVEYDMTISVAEDGRINGLLFGPPQPDRTPAASWDEIRDELEAAPYDVTLDVRESGADEPLFFAGSDSSSPIASTIKLYVLGAVVDAIASGSLTWETPLTIGTRVRSLPSGELQDLPDGSTVTVLEAAEKMISISDNTATDALILAVGREAVAAQLVTMGHADPASNTPFPTTREMFQLWANPELRESWAAADVSGRTTLLAEVPWGVPSLEDLDMTSTPWQDDVDWFATTADLARAHASLQQKAATDAGAPVRDILSANPGVRFGDEWTYVGYKGGSSSGVLTGSWYLEREDGKPVVITLLANASEPQALADVGSVFAIAQDAAALLAAE